MDTESGLAVLFEAASINGLSTEALEIIRNGSHLICKLDGALVARVGELGTQEKAHHEIRVSRWLMDRGIAAVEAAGHLIQPTVVSGQPVTWWKLLDKHRHATPHEIGTVLRKLHQLPVPETFPLPRLSLFNDTTGRLSHASFLGERDREWLRNRTEHLSDVFDKIKLGRPTGVIHGDAWQGNVLVVPSGQAVLADLESVCVGPIEWDLIAIAADYVDFARITSEEFESFVAAYGRDVTESPAFRVMTDIQELRWTLYVLGKATNDLAAAAEATHRIACIRGEIDKPWAWNAF